LIERAAPFLLTGVLLLAWEIIVPLTGLSELILPLPSAIGGAIVEYWQILLKHTQVTFLESVYGFALGIGIGVTLALGIFSWKAFERSVYPMLVVLNTVPKVALAPIFVLWFGFGWAPKVLIAFLIAFFPIVISTVVGLKGMDHDMVHLARSMGASQWQTFVKFRLPAAMPSIFGGLKVAITLAVIGAVIGEYVAAEEGLGYLQLLASSEFNSPLNFASLFFIALLGVLLFYVVEIVEKLLVRHR
jgi:NitT/TauT family transport system permease protein